MNRLRKALKSKEVVLILVIVLISLGIRFYNYPNRVTYGPEQARSLIVSARNITEGPSFLGQEYFRVTSKSHKLFYSSLFTFSLVPLLVLLRYDPVLITAFFSILNVFVGVVIYLVASKISNKTVALFSLILFLFNSSVIYHALFLWPYNYLPLFGILSLYLLFLYKKKNKLKYTLLLGFMSGAGFGIQYLYAVLVLPVVALLIYCSTKKAKSLLVFASGFALGTFPMIIFDLRHKFYYFNTVSQYLIDTLQGKSDASFNYYYLLPLWPIIAFLAGLVLYKLYKKSKMAAVAVLVLYLFVNMKSSSIDYAKPTGMAPGLNWKKILQASEIIAQDKPINFNIATLLDFDTRGYILRYPVEIIYGYKPDGEEEYPQSETVYVLSENDYNFNDPQVWELQVVMPYEVQMLGEIDSLYSVYKLVRQ